MGLNAGHGGGLGLGWKPWLPSDLGSALLSWYDPSRSMRIGGTMRAQGATPPVLTLTGTLTQALDIRIACTSIAGGAARGQWTGTYSLDGGTTTTAFTSAATVAIGASGITLNIATGNAATDNTWQSTVDQWTDLSKNGYVLSQSTATKQPTLLADMSGRICVVTDGAATYFRQSASLAAYAQPTHVFFVVRHLAAFAATDNMLDGFTANTLRFCRTDASTLYNYAGAGGLSGTYTTQTSAHLLECEFNGASSVVRVDGTQISAGNIGTTASHGLNVGCYGNETILFANAAFGDIVVCSSVLSAAKAARVRRYLKGRYGTP